MSKGSA